MSLDAVSGTTRFSFRQRTQLSAAGSQEYANFAGGSQLTAAHPVDTPRAPCYNVGTLGYFVNVIKPPVFLACLALAFLAPAAHAGTRHHHRHHHHCPPTQAAQRVQVDGVVAGVVDRLWNQGDVYWHAGDYPRIIALDRIVTQADPQFLEAYATGGWLMDSLCRTDDAEAYYTLGARNNPHSAYASWNLGLFYFMTKHDYPAAALALKHDTEQAGADLNDWKMFAHAQEHARQWDKAFATWHEIKRRWPKGMSVDRLLRESEEKRQKALQDPPVSGAASQPPTIDLPPIEGKPATP